MSPTFFRSAAEFRAWLEEHHRTATELLVALTKMSAPGGGLRYAEALDEALCFGWIDGVRRRVDDELFTIRFTPRRPGSIWSNVNVRHVARLTAAGRMQAPGLAAFAARQASKTGIYAFERKVPAKLPAASVQQLRANKKAWQFYSAQAPWYQRRMAHWIVAARQPATRERRLQRLIAACEIGQRL